MQSVWPMIWSSGFTSKVVTVVVCSSVNVAGKVVVVPGCSAAGVVCGGSVEEGEVDVEEAPACFPEGSGMRVLGNMV